MKKNIFIWSVLVIATSVTCFARYAKAKWVTPFFTPHYIRACLTEDRVTIDSTKYAS